MSANNKYMSSSQAASKWGLSARRVALLCEQKRVCGAEKVGNSWAIPIEAQKPVDARVKNGHYIKSIKRQRGATCQENEL